MTSPAARWTVNILALAGAVLIIASAIIHLRLWAQGYRGISVIGPLFLAQGVVSIPFAVALGVFRRLGLMATGTALMASTAAGLVLSAEIGLLGFKDSLAAPYAGMSLVTEIAAAIPLAAGAVFIAAARPSPARRGTRRRRSGQCGTQPRTACGAYIRRRMAWASQPDGCPARRRPQVPAPVTPGVRPRWCTRFSARPPHRRSANA